MRRYSGELFDADGINYKLDFDDKLSGMKIRMEQRHDFYLIFKEAVNNIYKHANASNVSVSLCRKDHNIIMRIEDNGKGITEQNLYRNGLKNMKSRAEKWGGDLRIESGENKGTILLLLLPAKK
jgi:signal transduction histidine kinase